jgi:hypothetical protein
MFTHTHIYISIASSVGSCVLDTSQNHGGVHENPRSIMHLTAVALRVKTTVDITLDRSSSDIDMLGIQRIAVM